MRVLFAGVLLTASVAGHTESISEAELLPPDAIELSLQETEQALGSEDGAPDFALFNEAWDSADSPTASYVRPERKSRSICRSCEFHLGVGGTYHSFENTGGVVIPMTVSWDRSRWEFGIFHFGEQTSDRQRRQCGTRGGAPLLGRIAVAPLRLLRARSIARGFWIRHFVPYRAGCAEFDPLELFLAARPALSGSAVSREL